jgi:hypothetical protein
VDGSLRNADFMAIEGSSRNCMGLVWSMLLLEYRKRRTACKATVLSPPITSCSPSRGVFGRYLLPGSHPQTPASLPPGFFLVYASRERRVPARLGAWALPAGAPYTYAASAGSGERFRCFLTANKIRMRPRPHARPRSF